MVFLGRPTGPAWAAVRVSVVSPLPYPGVAGKRRFSTFTAGRAAAVSRMSARPRRRLGVGDEIVRWLVKLTIRMARRVDKQHEGFVRAKARTKPTNCDND